ncbi:type 2 DNA topoisomerase 6 subunit B-like isoform X2 [Mercurialis annua]|uniref:type 2 DNA topoisomerase 6 subunit B-like isoform X2 n=1 Tax=Mercurialis annua TaxID=3986 RepID=UPI0021602F71|nr:type 2 DNA topoisomerase 6 subunit B-like isoform X2 [Mercurialis annua]
MEAPSPVTELCLDLILAAFQRCRVSEDICRLSIILKASLSPPSDSPIIRISISDTGIGSNLEEFQNLKCAKQAIDTQHWDGLLSFITTSTCDSEVYRYALNLRESVGNGRLTRLPSNPKNGAKFSGSEVCLSVSESLDALVPAINHFFRKNVAVDLVVENEDIPGSRFENVFLANESNPLPFSAPNYERLKSGLEDYVIKHGHRLNQNCNPCFLIRENLKAGIGMACSLESERSSGLIAEVVIIISECGPTCPYYSQCSSKTEILYFEDFRPCSIPDQFVNALSGIDWKSYGLSLGNVDDQEGNFLEWENLPPGTHISIVLHCYRKQPSVRRKSQADRSLIKRSVKLALDDLKEKYSGTLLSRHAVKIRSYAPDLAKSIAGLILTSNDSDFQEECFSLLGLQTKEIKEETVENCIKEKIISVINTNDRKSRKSTEMAAAPSLFEDDCSWNSNFHDKEYEEGDDESDNLFDYLD